MINTAIGRILSVAISCYTDLVNISFNSRITLLNAQAFNIVHTELAASSVSENNKALLVKIHSYISSPSHLSKWRINSQSQSREEVTHQIQSTGNANELGLRVEQYLCVYSQRVSETDYSHSCVGGDYEVTNNELLKQMALQMFPLSPRQTQSSLRSCQMSITQD